MKVYMCGVDWQHEVKQDYLGTKVYASVSDLKAAKNCTHQCGIVQLTLSKPVWIEEQKLRATDDNNADAKMQRRLAKLEKTISRMSPEEIINLVEQRTPWKSKKTQD